MSSINPVEAEIQLCLRGEIKAINFTKLGHIYITKILHKLVYDGSLKGKYLPIIYAEDTTPFLFPLGRLSTTKAKPEYSKEFNKYVLGAMSLRHHEIDFFVDFYLVLNSEISERGLTGLEEQEKAYQMTLQKLRSKTFLQSNTWIQLVHTGLQPIIVGIYQAVEEILYARRNSQGSPFVIEPMIFISENENNENSLITPQTRGSRIEDYRTLQVWF